MRSVVRKWSDVTVVTVGVVDVAVFAREMFTRPDRDVFVDVIGSVVSLHSLYLGAAVGGGLLALCGGWSIVLSARTLVWKRSRAFRFRELAPLIEKAMLNLENEAKEPGRKRLTSSSRALMRELIIGLDELGIPHPPTEGTTKDVPPPPWDTFLTRLLAASRTAQLQRAESLWQVQEKPM